MNRAPEDITIAAQRNNPSTITDMQNSNLVIVSDQSMEFPNPCREEYDTPPASTAEAMSPLSSRKRGQLRAASLGIGSIGRQGSTDPYPSFSAGVPNVPPPLLITNPTRPLVTVDQHQMREPFPEKPLHSIGSMLPGSDSMPGLQRDYFPNHLSNEIPQIAPRTFHSELSNGGEHYDERSNSHTMHDKVFPVANPYVERADEIGPSHRIPGVGHLGALLTPPGWREGDEPIDPQSAQRLYQAAREEAKNSLLMNFDEPAHLGPEEQEKRNADRDRQWNSRHQLDHVLYNERINVYNQYQKRKQLGFRPEYGQRQILSRSIALEPLQPINPPAMTTYAMTAHSPSPLHSNLHREPTRVNTSYSGQNQPGERSFPTPSSGIINPSLLDPTLLPQTLESIHRNYQNRNIEIQRMSDENNYNMFLLLKSCVPHLSQQQLSPGIPPPFSNERARPFYSGPNGNDLLVSSNQRATLVPRPPQYESLTRGLDGPSNPYQCATEFPFKGPPTSGEYQPGVPGYSIPAEEGKNQAHDQERQSVVQGNGHEVLNELKISAAEAKGTKENSPKPKQQRVLKEKVLKKNWYHDMLLKVDLPTSKIRDEYIQEELDANANGTKTERKKKSSPARRRRGGKLEFDPRVGIPVTDEAAEVLIANGALDHRNDPVTASSGAANSSTSNSAGVPPVPNGLSAYSSPYTPHPAEKTNFVFSRNAQPKSSPESEVSSDPPDDHKDGDYGRKATRQKSSTPGKSSSTRPTPRASNKRTSVNTVGANKRSRFSMDGPNDLPDDDADGTDGLKK